MKKQEPPAVLRLRAISHNLDSLSRKRARVLQPIERRVAALESERKRIFEESYPSVTGITIGDRVIAPNGRTAVADSYVLFYIPREGLPPKDYVGIGMRLVLSGGKLGKVLIYASAVDVKKAAS